MKQVGVKLEKVANYVKIRLLQYLLEIIYD